MEDSTLTIEILNSQNLPALAFYIHLQVGQEKKESPQLQGSNPPLNLNFEL